MQFDRTGTFIVSEIERAFSTTPKQGLPQLKIRVLVHEWFDESKNNGEGAWVDFTGVGGGMEGIAYCLLAYKDKKDNPVASFQHDELMDVYGWTGRDYQDLTTIDAPERFQVRVKDNDPEYAAKNPFVISNVGKADDDPRSGLKQISADAIMELNAKFASILTGGNTVAPTSVARKAPPKAPPKVAVVSNEDSGPPAEPKKQTAAAKKAAKRAKSEKVAKANAEIRAKAETSIPTPPAELEQTVKPSVAPPAVDQLDGEDVAKRDSITKEEAFATVYEMSKGVSDDTRNAAWTAAIADVAGVKTAHKNITGEQWHKIMHTTLDDVGVV